MDRSAAAEKHSMALQAAGRMRDCEVPSDEDRDVVVRRLAGVLPHVPFNEERIREKAVAALENVTAKASPGYPYMSIAPSNRELREIVGDSYLVDLAVERYNRIKAVSAAELRTWSAVRRVAEFLRDPVRNFGKNEVHNRKKQETGKLRLINSISLIDQLVERMLNSGLNSAEIKNWADIPVCPGMGLNDAGLSTIQEKALKFSRPAGDDVGGWDFCVEQWMMDDDARVRSLQSGKELGESMWEKLAILTGLTLLVYSDGEIQEQDPTRPGSWETGKYITSSGNSKMRAIAHDHAIPEKPLGVMAMGDDCIEDTPDGMTEDELIGRYARFGIRIKEVEIYSLTGSLEFCAYRFDLKGGVEPVRWHKMVASYCATWPVESQVLERYGALMHELRHSPHRAYVAALLEQVAIEAASEATR